MQCALQGHGWDPTPHRIRYKILKNNYNFKNIHWLSSLAFRSFLFRKELLNMTSTEQRLPQFSVWLKIKINMLHESKAQMFILNSTSCTTPLSKQLEHYKDILFSMKPVNISNGINWTISGWGVGGGILNIMAPTNLKMGLGQQKAAKVNVLNRR